MCQPSGCPRCNPSYRRGLAAITALEAATIAPEERKLRVSVTTAHSPTRSYWEGGARCEAWVRRRSSEREAASLSHLESLEDVRL